MRKNRPGTPDHLGAGSRFDGKSTVANYGVAE